MLLLKPEPPLSAIAVAWTLLLEKEGKFHLQEAPSQQVKHLI